MRFVTLATLEDRYQAQFVERALAEQGIRCIIAHENATDLMPHLTGVMGLGVEIRVAEVDYLQARHTIDMLRENDHITCPECGSTDIEFKPIAARAPGIFVLLLSILAFTPVAPRHMIACHCSKCGCEFQKRKL